jgi:hypothetical protein
MKSRAVGLSTLVVVLAGLVVLLPTGRTQHRPSPLEQYRKLAFPPADENFEKGWQDRVALELEVVNREDLKPLREALKDKSPFVRSVAARALGIRGDRASANALAELVKADPEYMVRIRAVESLALLKVRPEVIELARKDRQAGVQWAAVLAAGQVKSVTDDAALVRQAYAAGIRREEMGSARVGQRAPDFTARTIDGKLFRLSDVLGKKPIAIYFAAFDG